MNPRSIQLVVLLLLMVTSPALAGINVTSYETLARVNGFAPISQTEYFQQQTLTNVSPALAQVSGDWMGTNSTGSALTWHYVGSAEVASTTTFDANSLTVTAGGSFAYTVDTTAGFVDPGGVTIYPPSATANYNGFFTTDVPTTYTMTGQVQQWGRVRLNSLDGSVVFDLTNFTATSIAVSFHGSIAPGQYRVLLAAGLGAPNLPSGINHYSASGSYESMVFNVQVPEPSALGTLTAMILTETRRRKRSARARACYELPPIPANKHLSIRHDAAMKCRPASVLGSRS